MSSQSTKKNILEIIKETTSPYRKGEPVEVRNEGGMKVIEMVSYSSISKAPKKEDTEIVDMVFFYVAVDKRKAEQYKKDLELVAKDLLSENPEFGVNYIEIPGKLGIEQDHALRLMALGKVLGLWEIVTPKNLGFSEEEALKYARRGLIYIYKSE